MLKVFTEVEAGTDGEFQECRARGAWPVSEGPIFPAHHKSDNIAVTVGDHNEVITMAPAEAEKFMRCVHARECVSLERACEEDHQMRA